MHATQISWMDAANANPYKTPVDVSPSVGLTLERFISMSVTAVSLVLAISASLGAFVRCFAELGIFETWRNLAPAASPSSLFAVFGIASWLLLGLTSGIERCVPPKQVVFSKGLILIATVTMFVRLATEPTAAWTPMWPAYALTFTGMAALGMVMQRIKRQFTTLEKPLRQTEV